MGEGNSGGDMIRKRRTMYHDVSERAEVGMDALLEQKKKNKK